MVIRAVVLIAVIAIACHEIRLPLRDMKDAAVHYSLWCSLITLDGGDERAPNREGEFKCLTCDSR